MALKTWRKAKEHVTISALTISTGTKYVKNKIRMMMQINITLIEFGKLLGKI